MADDTERTLSDSEIAFIKEQSRLLAAELSWHARGPVRLHLIGGKQYAFTIDAGGEGNTIDVFLNPTVLLEIRNQRRAIHTWFGMGFHELAHHLWPATDQYQQALTEGYKDLFNLLDDEQNERRGRARDPKWGAYFQTTIAWVFRKKNTTESGYTRRWNEFAYHFRRNLPQGVTDEVVAEALGLIPKNFKDLSKDELLDLCRKIHETLSRGLPPPPKPVNTPEKPPEEKSPEPQPPPPEVKPAEAEPPAGSVWTVLFRSVWSYVFLAICIAGWSLLFTRKGLSGWDGAFWLLLVVVGFTVAVVAFLVWLDKRLKKAKSDSKPVDSSLAIAAYRQIIEQWQGVKAVTGSILGKVLEPVGAVIDRLPAKALSVMGAIYLAGRWLFHGWKVLLVTAATQAWRLLKTVGRALVWVYETRIFRIILISAPLAVLLVMITAVAVKMNWKEFFILLALLLLLLLLAWLLRKRIGLFLLETKGEEAGTSPQFSQEDLLEFNVIQNIVPIKANQAWLDLLLPNVLALAQQMRTFFEQCGRIAMDKEDQESGEELSDDLEKQALGETGLWIDDPKKPAASVDLQVAIDCSGSMDDNKIRVAKRFGLLIEESIRGVKGISSHFWGFTDRHIYDCGVAGEGRVSGLQASNGNNDSAMLWHMYKSALASGKNLKILLMISDGQPTECTWDSLHNLVLHLEESGSVPVQIAVDTITRPAFQRFFVDLANQPLEAAIIQLGQLLLSLVEENT